MVWFISKERDSEDEFNARVKFYESVSGRPLSVVDSKILTCYEFNDGRGDNRCMIIGHTDTAIDVMVYLRGSSRKKYKIYLSVCEMTEGTFAKWQKTISYEFYSTEQERFKVGKNHILGCEFLEKEHIGFEFRATRSEINIYNSEFTGFFNKLDSSFKKI